MTRTAKIVTVIAAIAAVALAGPSADAATHGKRAYHNHGRHATAPSSVKGQSAATATPPVGSACKATEKAGDTINQHVGTWTRADVEAFIGCAGVLDSSQGTSTATYGWDNVKGHVLLVTFLNDVVKEPVHYR